MHEYSIARSLVEVVCEEARRAGAVRVNYVEARVGVMTMVDAWLLQEAWVIACEGTTCEGSALVVEKCPVWMTCRGCGHRESEDVWPGHCPVCGGADGRVSGGDELDLTRMDVDINGGSATDDLLSVAAATRT